MNGATVTSAEDNQTTSGSWQPDPTGRYRLRWCNEAGGWTDHVYGSDGKMGHDPYDPPPPPPPNQLAEIGARVEQSQGQAPASPDSCEAENQPPPQPPAQQHSPTKTKTARSTRVFAVIGKAAVAVVTVPLSLIAWFVIAYLRGRHPDHPAWDAWNSWWAWIGVLVSVGVAGIVLISLL